MRNKIIAMSEDSRRAPPRTDDAYLKLVGDRVRLERVRRGLSRKALSEVSGVSERYLAELERGTGNASLLVLRQIATAMQTRMADLASEEADRSIDLSWNALTTGGEDGPTTPPQHPHLLTESLRKPSARDRIAFIGLRCAGKSVAGAATATALSIPFVDLDADIERVSGLKLDEILKTQGADVYRDLERNALDSVLAHYPCVVIAAGGGIVTEPPTYERLLATCYVIWLKATVEQHVNRAIRKGHLRPQAKSRRAVSEFRVVLDSRTPLYEKAHAIIDTTFRDEAETLAEILRLVRR